MQGLWVGYLGSGVRVVGSALASLQLIISCKKVPDNSTGSGWLMIVCNHAGCCLGWHSIRASRGWTVQGPAQGKAWSFQGPCGRSVWRARRDIM